MASSRFRAARGGVRSPSRSCIAPRATARISRRCSNPAISSPRFSFLRRRQRSARPTSKFATASPTNLRSPPPRWRWKWPMAVCVTRASRSAASRRSRGVRATRRERSSARRSTRITHSALARSRSRAPRHASTIPTRLRSGARRWRARLCTLRRWRSEMSVEAPAAIGNMGEPHPRLDARLKVTGGARYASDMPLENPAYAFLVTSAIARGSIRSIDLDAAQNVPGVLHIMMHENTSRDVKDSKLFSNGGFSCTSIKPLESAKIWHDGQIVAVVIAETFEAAREAGYRIKIQYDAEQPSATFDSAGVQVQAAAEVKKTHEDPKVGDFDGAFAAADVKIDAKYSTPTQHHNPIELFTTTCAWSGGKLTVYEPSQSMYGVKNGVASQLGIDPDQVHSVSHFVGGAFGSRGSLTPRTALTAIAARRVGRPVKLVATRQQGFTIATYRAETKQRVRLGAARDGKLTALSHEGWEITSRPDNYMVAGTNATTRMYDVPNVYSKVSVVHADRNTPGFMRSPPVLPYMFGLESAMDELAYALDIDPIELRRKNDTMNESIKGLPYTSRSLMQCFDEGAKTFGWAKRNPKAGSMRKGAWLVGLGCATSCYPTQMAPASARVRLSQNGELRVETASHEIGNGAYTVIGQIAAERLGILFEKVTVALGDSNYPACPVAGGSVTTASVCNCVAEACDAIRAELGINDPRGDVLAALKSR